MHNRIEKMKEAALKTMDALMITKDENKFYLSGFRSSNFTLVFTKEDNYLLTDFRYYESALKLADLYQIVLLKADYSLDDFIGELQIRTLGIEFTDLRLDFYKNLEKRHNKISYEPVDEILTAIRLYKSDDEIKTIGRAAALNDAGFHYLLGEIKPGMTEIEVALKLEFFLRSHGAEGLAFETIVASGPRSSLPHGTPTERKLAEGDLITIDFGCKLDGYCSDMTRTVGLGALNAEQQKIYKVVLEAQQKVLDQLKLGMKCSAADQIARDHITAMGYGDAFGHGLGHGVGLEIHEGPILNPSGDHVLAPGMIITIEPGIYLPGKFGVRIEDLAAVTPFGIINLTNSRKDLINIEIN